jgi:hypothetical protein
MRRIAEPEILSEVLLAHARRVLAPLTDGCTAPSEAILHFTYEGDQLRETPAWPTKLVHGLGLPLVLGLILVVPRPMKVTAEERLPPAVCVALCTSGNSCASSALPVRA